MPSKQKTLQFLSAFAASIGSFALICTCLGTSQWNSSRVNYSAGNYSGYISIKQGLFQGTFEKLVTEGVGLGKQPLGYDVLQALKESGSVLVLHVLVILLLVLGLFSSFLSSATTCLNSVSNPYLTFLGPLGVYVWSSINAGLVLLAMILFASNVELNDMPKKVAELKDASNDLILKTSNAYGYSFWLLLLSIILNITTIIVIYFYQHARYSKKKEQERPMEAASKDVILF
ncbi:clarin-3 [Discoglossus pictus]